MAFYSKHNPVSILDLANPPLDEAGQGWKDQRGLFKGRSNLGDNHSPFHILADCQLLGVPMDFTVGGFRDVGQAEAMSSNS